MDDELAFNLADLVHGVGKLKSVGSLGCVKDVAPLVTDIAYNILPSISQLLPLTGVVGHHGAGESGQIIHPEKSWRHRLVKVMALRSSVWTVKNPILTPTKRSLLYIRLVFGRVGTLPSCM